MTRQIKFRCWEKKDKMMVDGEYWLVMDSTGRLYEYSLGKLTDKTDEYEVMQFTGLFDKTGKEIYEGDVVNYNEERMLIKYDEFGYDCCECGIGFVFNSFSYEKEDCEVIGNIYQNKDLLDGLDV